MSFGGMAPLSPFHVCSLLQAFISWEDDSVNNQSISSGSCCLFLSVVLRPGFAAVKKTKITNISSPDHRRYRICQIFSGWEGKGVLSYKVQVTVSAYRRLEASNSVKAQALCLCYCEFTSTCITYLSVTHELRNKEKTQYNDKGWVHKPQSVRWIAPNLYVDNRNLETWNNLYTCILSAYSNYKTQ